MCFIKGISQNIITAQHILQNSAETKPKIYCFYFP